MGSPSQREERQSERPGKARRDYYSTNEITNESTNQKEGACNGPRDNQRNNTVLELVKHSDGSGFDSFVFICEEKHRDTIQEIAAEMQEALEEWLKHCVYPHGDISARNQLNQKDFCRYGTLDDALTFLFTALKYPDSILT